MRKEKLVSAIGTPEKASSCLFYVSGEEEISTILEYFNSSLKCGVGDLSAIRPEDSEGKKAIISIKQIRELIHFVNLSPGGGAKVAAVIGAESMNKESANAFLKTLEEPPKNSVILLFASSRILLPTIKSRCKIYNFQQGIMDENDIDESMLKSLRGNFKEMSDAVEVYIKNEKLNDLIFAIECLGRRNLLALRTSDSTRFMKEIEKVKSEIKRNANPKLAIESLVLRNRKLIGD